MFIITTISVIVFSRSGVLPAGSTYVESVRVSHMIYFFPHPLLSSFQVLEVVAVMMMVVVDQHTGELTKLFFFLSVSWLECFSPCVSFDNQLYGLGVFA